jgi:tetratricopeptide (TPR) repeat protein
MLGALNSRIVIVSVLGVGILGLGIYSYITSNNHLPRFSDIHPPSDSTCPLDFISQVNCFSNHTIGPEKHTKSSAGGTQVKQLEQANYAAKTGAQLELAGNLQGALKYYDKGLLLEPTNPDLLVGKADTLTLLTNYSGAITYYVKALALYPNSTGSTDVKRNIGNDLYKLGKYWDAIKYYDSALATRPNDSDLLINRGNALAHTANFSGAIASYDKALALHPNSTITNTASVMRTEALSQIGNYRNAIR